MSARKGDKARHNIQRLAKIQRRIRLQALMEKVAAERAAAKAD